MGYHMVFFLSFFFKIYCFIFIYAVCVHDHLGIPRSQKTAADPLGLELQGVVRHL